MSAPCPTPTKSRYATREAAAAAAARVQVGVGQILNPYPCMCTWWHLTKREAVSVDRPDPAIVDLVAALGDEAFTDVVARDIRGQAHPAEAAALRQPGLLVRWDTAVAQFQISIEGQFATKAGDRGEQVQEWRRRASHLRFAAATRRKEARALIAAQHRQTPDQQLAKAAETEAARENWSANRAAKASNDAEYAAAGITREEQKRLSREAGDEAIHRLVEAHRSEFNALLVEECRVRGCLPPRALRNGSIPAPQSPVSEPAA